MRYDGPMLNRDRLIVALDVPSASKARQVVQSIGEAATTYKVGKQLFTAEGPQVVRDLVSSGRKVFLDLKFHDIPNTVAGAAREAARMGVFMFNVHASGGLAMLRAATEAKTAIGAGDRRPLVIAVTVLTSLDRAALSRELGVASSVEGHVLHLCRLAKEAGLDGCVASPNEISTIRNQLGADWVIVTPGVRPAGADINDQSRIATPGAAARAGAHYLVVGRPITAAADPSAAARAILTEIAG